MYTMHLLNYIVLYHVCSTQGDGGRDPMIPTYPMNKHAEVICLQTTTGIFHNKCIYLYILSEHSFCEATVDKVLNFKDLVAK